MLDTNSAALGWRIRSHRASITRSIFFEIAFQEAKSIGLNLSCFERGKKSLLCLRRLFNSSGASEVGCEYL